MKFLPLVHIVIAGCGAVLAWLIGGSHASASFSVGAAVALFNLTLLVIVWPLILAKKLVALSIGVIVFKFAILAWIINEVATGNQFHLGWFAVGLGTLVPSVLATAAKASRSSSEAKP